MKPRRLWAIARKEFLHVRRDPRSLYLAVCVPLVLLLLFGYALTLDLKDAPLMVWDQSNTPASRELISGFTGSSYFRLRGTARNYLELEQAIDSGRAMVALVIPVDFAQALESGKGARVQLILDGSAANSATLARGYATAMVSGYSLGIQVEQLQARGIGVPPVPVDFRPRVWYNQDLESRNYIIPGLIAVILMVIAAMLTSLTVAKEWETGTMEQLISTPVKSAELAIGKLLPYFVIALADALMVVLMGQFVFDVPLRGSLWLLAGTSLVYLPAALSLGLLVSIVTKSQLLSSQLAVVLTYLPALLLSGFSFDIRSMPQLIQIITHVVVARYFITILKGVYLKGVGLEVLAWPVLLLCCFSLAVVVVAVKKFRKRMD